MKIFVLTLFGILFTLNVVAQDQIYKKNGSVIAATVEEIGLNEIKYREWQADGPLMSIDVALLQKIVLQNGRVIEFKDPLTDPENYEDQKKTALKLNFLSPLFESTSFTLEKSIRPGRSFETQLGFIGLGFNTDPSFKSAGISLGAGYKYLRTPDFYSSRMKYAHILKGSYVKPEVLISIFHSEYSDTYYTGMAQNYEQDVFAGALVLNLGKQVIYDDSFLIDYSIGVGYGFTTQDENQESYYWQSNQYGFFIASPDVPLVLKFNLRIGFLL